jgi:hypothetical protein
MNDIERIRASLHHALADGHPQEEILRLSRCLDAMIVAACASNTNAVRDPSPHNRGETKAPAPRRVEPPPPASSKARVPAVKHAEHGLFHDFQVMRKACGRRRSAAMAQLPERLAMNRSMRTRASRMLSMDVA